MDICFNILVYNILFYFTSELFTAPLPNQVHDTHRLSAWQDFCKISRNVYTFGYNYCWTYCLECLGRRVETFARSTDESNVLLVPWATHRIQVRESVGQIWQKDKMTRNDQIWTKLCKDLAALVGLGPLKAADSANQSWVLSVFFNLFNNKKWSFAFFIKLIWLGVGFLNRTGAEIGYHLHKKQKNHFLWLKK